LSNIIDQLAALTLELNLVFTPTIKADFVFSAHHHNTALPVDFEIIDHDRAKLCFYNHGKCAMSNFNANLSPSHSTTNIGPLSAGNCCFNLGKFFFKPVLF